MLAWIVQPWQVSLERAEKTGRPEHDTKDTAAGTRQLRQDKLARLAGTGHLGLGIQDRTSEIGHLIQDIWYMTSGTGQPGQDSRDRSVWTGQVSLDRTDDTGQPERIILNFKSQCITNKWNNTLNCFFSCKIPCFATLSFSPTRGTKQNNAKRWNLTNLSEKTDNTEN